MTRILLGLAAIVSATLMTGVAAGPAALSSAVPVARTLA